MNKKEINNESAASGTKMKCDDIQPLLMAYMTHELGGGTADLVREHLRKCEVCQAEAAEIQKMTDLLRKAGGGSASDGSEHLSRERRERITWAILHPVLDWMYRHHIIVSVLVAIAATFLIFTVIRHKPLWETLDDKGIPVTIGRPEQLKNLPGGANTNSMVPGQ